MNGIIGKKVITVTILSIVIAVVVIVVCMQLDTNALMKEVEAAFLSKDAYLYDCEYNPDLQPEKYAIPGVNYIVKPISDAGKGKPDLFFLYNSTRYTLGVDEFDADISVHRLFAWHNFKKGILWFEYTRNIKDKEGNILIGSGTASVKLTMEKINGKWEVVDIYERP